MEVNKPFTKDLDKSIADCYKILLDSKKIAITTHVNPDGDAIGCELALYFYALSKGIGAKIINYSETPYNLLFLDGVDKVELFDESSESPHRKYIGECDTIFLVDLNNSSRVKSMSDAILNAKVKKIIIDHHMEPDDMADLYVIDPDSTSTGEIIWKLLKKDSGMKFTPAMATALYAAIMSDTGSFRFPRTDAETHRIVAELIECGADPVDIYEEIYNIIPFEAARLLGEAFAGMEKLFDGRLVLMKLPKESFERTGASEDDTEGIVEHTVTIKNVMVGVLLIERPGDPQIRISFRSKGDINVRDIAVSLGGGGHHHAAGARISGKSLEEVRRIIIESAGKLFR